MSATDDRISPASLEVLGVFAKFWQPGRVKTRLARSIGAEPAATLYHASLRTTLARLSHLADRRVLAFTPASQCDEFAALATVVEGCWSHTPQVDGDLGERMAGFFADQFARGAGRVVLLGSDSPTVPVAHLVRAFQMLREHDVVIGPSRDGGYYLVGQSSPRPDMFGGIAWSSAQVWPQTRDRLDSLGATYAVLPEWYDIDAIDDLRQLAEEIDTTERPDDSIDILRDAVTSALGSLDQRK